MKSSVRVSTSTRTTWSSGKQRSGISRSGQCQPNNNLQSASSLSTDDEMDAYVQRLLEQASTAAAAVEGEGSGSDEAYCAHVATAAMIDESLGPYVTSCLRNSSNNHNKSENKYSTAATAADVTAIPDFESLCELLQEHCQIEQPVAAADLLKRIAEAVFSGRVPNVSDNNNNILGVSNVSSDTEDADALLAEITDFRSLMTLSNTGANTDNHHEQDFQQQQQQKQYHQPQAVTSSLAAGSLLPINLLEEDEDDNVGGVFREKGGFGSSSSASSPPRDDDAFPPLGAQPSETSTAKASTKKTKQKHPPPKGSCNGSSSGGSNSQSKLKKSAAAEELAAALFRPSRSRQSSIDESSAKSSPLLHAAVTAQQQQPPSIPEQQLMLHHHQQHHYNNPYANASNNNSDEQQLQHHLHNTAEILITMNLDLSDDAAYAASVLAGADLNVAQYIIEQAVAQLPVCRHLLTDGCYRADCSFSHDIDSHTCLFWLRSRCGKGAAQCRFLHGFAEKLLENLPEHIYTYNNNNDDDDDDDTANNAAAVDYYGGSGDYGAAYVTAASNTEYVAAYSNSGGGSSSSAAPAHSSLWIPSPPPSSSSNSFANIASQGYDTRQSFVATTTANDNISNCAQHVVIPTASIPLDLWNPQEYRDPAAFYISDPLERYHEVTAATAVPRENVIDLHFQSLKTFPIVLDAVLPLKLQRLSHVWIITGTGHHVGTRTHQKGGGTLESAVLEYLTVHHYTDCYAVSRGRDRNGQGGAILVQKQRLR